MKLELLLSDDRKTICEFTGNMQAAYDQYSDKPFLLDGVEATVCRIHYVPDPIDLHMQRVTACFAAELEVVTIPCRDFRLGLAPYCQDQMGHEVICELENGQKLVRSWLLKPEVLLILDAVDIPSSVLYEEHPGSSTELPWRRGRYPVHDPRNLKLIADWCKEREMPYYFI